LWEATGTREGLRAAAERYRRAALPADAARCWQQLGRIDEAVELWSTVGEFLEAGWLLLRDGQTARARGTLRMEPGTAAVRAVRRDLGVALSQAAVWPVADGGARGGVRGGTPADAATGFPAGMRGGVRGGTSADAATGFPAGTRGEGPRLPGSRRRRDAPSADLTPWALLRAADARRTRTTGAGPGGAAVGASPDCEDVVDQIADAVAVFATGASQTELTALEGNAVFAADALNRPDLAGEVFAASCRGAVPGAPARWRTWAAAHGMSPLSVPGLA
ncbi:MAG: hypothetical protein HOW97_31810, partial [Catenulispora sp.]|nr:hypothetical protein [Catenulispora sp.]